MRLALLALSLSFAAAGVSAATIDVTRFDDPEPDGCDIDGCTLREAIALAGQDVALDLVRLPAGTFTLSPQASGSVTITMYTPVRIEGATRTSTIIRSTGPGSMLANYSDLTLRRMTLREGVALGDSTTTGVGGAVRVQGGHFDAAGVSFLENSATTGGAVAVLQGSAELLGAYFFDNTSPQGAGALTLSSSQVVIANSRFERNEGLGGGAILSASGSLSLSDGTRLRNNSAQSGGAVVSNHEITIDDTCDVSFNVATGYGGAFHGQPTLHVRGVATAGGPGLVRIEGNVALVGGAFSAFSGVELERVAADGNEAESGGALYLNAPAPLSIRDSRFSGNHASSSGGALYTRGQGQLQRVSLESNSAGAHGGAMTLGNGAVIDAYNLDVYGNTAPSAAGIYNAGVLSLRHATLWDNRAGHAFDALHQASVGSATYANSIVAGRCTGSTAAISAAGKNLRTNSFLGNNCDGTTATAASLQLVRGLHGHDFEVSGLKTSGSVAVDAGAASHCLRQDVRDAPRDVKCDIGAFEHGAMAQ